MSISVRRWLAVPALLLSLLVAGCSTAPATTSSTSGLRVVVAFYPYQFVAERLVGDLGQVQNLTTPGAEPHDLELTATQVAAIASADLVIYQKGFQPAVDNAITQANPSAVMDVTTIVPLRESLEQESADDHAGDPHLWLDPTNLATIATAVSAKLAPLSAEPAAINQRRDALTAQLGELDTTIRAGLATCERRVFVTSHAAFAYLAARYELNQVAIAGLDPSTEPSPARIKQVHDVVAAQGVTTIFYETLVSDAVARSIATDLGLRTDVLDPLEGLTDASRGTDYVQVMTANLQALRTAGDCR
ncbi:MAG: metal ABC transporter substrate-binding protein [Micropruina sp.]